MRWGIIKLADIVLRGVEETPPKVTIHLPPTPVIEAPPPLPSVKLPPKPPRPLKSGGPPPRPIPVPSAPPKLKILPGGVQARSTNSSVTASAAPTPPARAGTMAPPPVPAKAKGKPKPKPVNGVRAPHLPKAQSAGMSLNDLRASRNALKKLKMHKSAVLFMQPVDPVRDHAPKSVLILIMTLHFFSYAVVQLLRDHQESYGPQHHGRETRGGHVHGSVCLRGGFPAHDSKCEAVQPCWNVCPY